MIDVFFCTSAKKEDEIRWNIMKACLARWEMEPGINLVTLTGAGKSFQRERRRIAAKESVSDIYIVVEDDIMPLGRRFVERGVGAMREHPGYAVLGPRTVWEQQLSPVVEVGNGDICDFIRKGTVDKVLREEEWFDGVLQSARLREIGWKTGRMRDVAVNHFGFKLGTTWPDDYNSGMTQIAEYP